MIRVVLMRNSRLSQAETTEATAEVHNAAYSAGVLVNGPRHRSRVEYLLIPDGLL
jgi:hypothetical protein